MKIRVIDDMQPEAAAMLQALYSRSPASVDQHIEDVRERGPERFMSQYYVGYGHQSIGDCGDTDIFVEGISMLAAKALQDNPLYRGQEASTRYMDFSKSGVHSLGEEEDDIAREWVNIYLETYPVVLEQLTAAHPKPEEVKEATHRRALEARAFDIVRSLLPAGSKTNVSWSADLRNASDHLKRMMLHPLPEIRMVAHSIYAQLREKYPSSFGDVVLDPDSVEWPYRVKEHYHITGHDVVMPPAPCYKPQLEWASFQNSCDGMVRSARVPGLPPSRRPMAHGIAKVCYSLDFASFRDLQRHRGSYIPIPVIGHASPVIHPWYIDMWKQWVPNWPQLMGKVHAQLCRVEQLHSRRPQAPPSSHPIPGNIPLPELQLQYLLPMGTVVHGLIVAPLNQLAYIAELRSKPTVHPTLRPLAQDIGQWLYGRLRNSGGGGGAYCRIDHSPDGLCSRRGQQTITAKTGDEFVDPAK